MRDKIIVEKIANAIATLDEIDGLIKSQPSELQTIDYELSDWYHYIENNEMDDETSVNIIKRIKELRIKRRALKNEYEIETTYQQHKSKLSGDTTRQFLLNVYKTKKRLETEYKNRVITDDDILLMIGQEKKRRGRPRKEISEE